jgi:hypothetical protein
MRWSLTLRDVSDAAQANAEVAVPLVVAVVLVMAGEKPTRGLEASSRVVEALLVGQEDLHCFA